MGYAEKLIADSSMRIIFVGREYKQEEEGEEGAEERMKRMYNPCTFLPNIGQKIGSGDLVK